MNAVLANVRQLVDVELAAANERFPQFHSQHEGRSNSMSEWISVKERLPEEKQRVIVRCERIGTSVGWILWGEWMTDIGPSAGKITHWMPLPEPPKEG